MVRRTSPEPLRSSFVPVQRVRRAGRIGPSPVPYGPGSPIPREITGAEMDSIRQKFVAWARRAAAAGFDVLELHCAQGYPCCPPS